MPETPPGVLPALGCVCLATVVVVLAVLRDTFSWWDAATVALYLAAGLFAAASLAGAVVRSCGAGRRFWAWLGAGALLFFLGGPAGGVAFGAGSVAAVGLHAAAVLVLLWALFAVLARTSRRVKVLASLDVAMVTFSTAALLAFFVATPAELASVAGGTPAAAVFLRPVLGVGLLCYALVLVSVERRPPFAGLLALAFLAAAAAEFVLFFRAPGFVEPGLPERAAWILAPLFLGLAARKTSPAAFEWDFWETGVHPVRQLLFWAGPFSPAVHFGAMLLWSAARPSGSVPGYVLLGSAAVLAYLVLRTFLFARTVHRWRPERDAAVARLERLRFSEELHDTLKQDVCSVAMALHNYEEARRKGDPDAEGDLKLAMEACRNAEGRAGRLVRELHPSGARRVDLLCQLRQALADVKRYSGKTAHEDLRAGLDGLGAEEMGAAYRIASEALWNAAKHSGAENVWLESREAGCGVLLRVRDDGRGFPPGDPEGMGMTLMRLRAEEVGAELELRAGPPGEGTTVEVRFGGR